MEHDNAQAHEEQQSQPQQTSGLAIAGMVLGILSFCGGLFTAIPAVICSLVALSKISKSKGSLTGQGFAIAGLATGGVGMIFGTAMMAGFLMPAIMRARLHAESTACKSNLRQIGMAAMTYLDTNDNQYPPNLKALADSEFVTDMDMFLCPEDDAPARAEHL